MLLNINLSFKQKLILSLLFFMLIGFLLPTPEIHVDKAYCSISWQDWLGCSPLGENMLLMVIKGTWITLVSAFLSRLLSVFLSFLGLAFAHFTSVFGNISEKAIVESFMSIPSLLLAMALGFSFGSGLFSIVLAIGISEWAFNQRWLLTRLQEYYALPYYQFAQDAGASKFHLFSWHIVPELNKDLIFLFFVHFPGTVLTVAALEFLGLRTSTEILGLGYMVSAYKDYIFLVPHLAIVPIISITLLLITVIPLKRKT
ncbi:MAG: ABC transporter permease subunit [Candidatus Hydrogenedentota bacterium]|nr:MAG: ABC transporter permease subunit [Candidatus Hydrogenedentota bacterium]